MRPIPLALTAALALAALALALALALGGVGESVALETSSPASVATDPVASSSDAPLQFAPQGAESRRDLATRAASAPAAPAPDHSGRSLFFRVEDEAGEPLAGALVRAVGKPGVQSLPTGSSGKGRLDGVQPSHRVLLVGASERRVLRVPFGRGGEDPERPLVFVLPPGSRLIIILRDSRGDPLEGVRLELSTDSRLFEGTEEWGPSSLHLAISGTPFTEASWNKRGGQVIFRTEADGSVRLSGIRPNVPLQVVVRDVVHTILCREQFQGPGTGELLRREFVLDASLVDLAGQVVDDEGQALYKVRVELRAEGRSVRASTDLAGRFEFSERLVSASPLELWASLDGYDPLRLEDLVLGPDAGLPQLVLRSGPGFYLTIVDEDGDFVLVFELKAEAPGWPPFQGRLTRSRRYRFPDLPPGRLSLSARVGPHTFEREFDPSEDSPTWVLPTLGRLVVTVAEGARPSSRPTALVVRVTSLDDPLLVHDAHLGSNGSTSTLRLGPGKWTVQLHRWVDGVHRWVEAGSPIVLEPLGRSFEVEIHAGELRQLDLD